VSFDHRPKAAHSDTPPAILPEAQQVASGVQDAGLRMALERLASNVYSKTQDRT
jgi:hypothetical protein